ncbi:hypothetical protein M3Y99_01913200 [Aphelenchoides fujianensis]|nr:hypothetical protein M3Y99_01913200 [Aphelenchoides fujianensis]
MKGSGVGLSDCTNECHIFEQPSVRRTDGLIEADDRYSFYWKYCLKTEKKCNGDYGFNFLSDRYIDVPQVNRTTHFDALEDCLAECLNEEHFHCRAVAFNRTSGACSLSEFNQLSKPSMIRINNNPNYRIDYYENNCFNTSSTFHFDYTCEEEGFRISIKSQFPYTGALYGLYDFFTCRLEPRESTRFDYLFPYPTHSKNCSDSIRYKGNEMLLEVVLSTDGVEPLYFITADDLTYQARCPIDPKDRKKTTTAAHKTTTTLPPTTTSDLSNHVQLVSDAEKEGTFVARSQKIRMMDESTERHKSTSRRPKSLEAFTVPEAEDHRPTTKDIFPLPLFTTTTTDRSPVESSSAAVATWMASEGPHLDSEPPTTSTSTPSTRTTPEQPTSRPTTRGMEAIEATEARGESVSTNARADSFNFDIFHNGQPTEAVVVGSRITLSFTPYFAIPPAYMSISGCQVEPIDPLYEWEKEPLAIIKDGCQADHVGLVCPPQRTDFGISVTVESFRYQTTTQVQYTCLVRVCPFSPCPTTTCPSVEGCAGDDLLSRTLGLRSKRYVSLDQIRAAFSANPALQQQLALGTGAPGNQLSNSLQQQLITIGGDHIVRKRLVVVNTDDELSFYVKTGNVPEHLG